MQLGEKSGSDESDALLAVTVGVAIGGELFSRDLSNFFFFVLEDVKSVFYTSL